MKVYRDYQTMTDKIQERGHGPTRSIDIYARRIKSPPSVDRLMVSLADLLKHRSPAVAWILGVRE